MKRILFIEGDDSLRRLYWRLFERKQYADVSVEFTGDINIARESLQTTPFQLIVLDIRFAHDQRAGLTFLRELRDSGNNVPAVIYTGVPEQILREDLEGRNCITVIPKSLTSDEVMQRIDEAIFLVDAGMTEGSEHLDLLESMAVQFNMEVGEETEDGESKDTPGIAGAEFRSEF